MTSVVAIDPGPSISAYAVLEDGWPVLIGIDAVSYTHLTLPTKA